MGLELVHLELAEANDFVADLHRHHKPDRGHRFSIGAVNGDILVGVAIVGRPKARGCDYKTTVEVTRLCTNGHKNACSFLYGRAARAADALGYEKIQTYILSSEPGTSLLAVGWTLEAVTAGGAWKHSSGPRANDHPLEPKQRWARYL